MAMLPLNGPPRRACSTLTQSSGAVQTVSTPYHFTWSKFTITGTVGETQCKRDSSYARGPFSVRDSSLSRCPALLEGSLIFIVFLTSIKHAFDSDIVPIYTSESYEKAKPQFS